MRNDSRYASMRWRAWPLSSWVLALALAGCTPALLSPPSTPASPEDQRVRATLTGEKDRRSAARRKLERFRFERARKLGTIFGWKRFLRQHPRGLFAGRARERLARLRFKRAEGQGNAMALRRFLRLHGNHPLAARAWRRLLKTRAARLARSGTRLEIEAFLRRHPKSDAERRLRRRLEALDFKLLAAQAPLPDLERFLRRHPGSPHRAAIRKRIEERIAQRIRAFGTLPDLRGFLDRYPASRHAPGFRRRLVELRLQPAVLAFDVRRLAARTGQNLRHRAVRTWLLRIRGQQKRLATLGKAAGPYRPFARVRAMLAAARGRDPGTAAMALRALQHVPTLDAFRALLKAVAAPDPGVALVALDALAAWTGGPGQGVARRKLLQDQLAAARRRKDVASRVRALALAWALGDRPVLRRLLEARQWHRPWALVPHHLRMLAWSVSAPRVANRGRAAVKAYRAEFRRLVQMLPRKLGRDSRRRAEGATFELQALARGAEGILARHGTTGRWQRGLQDLADRSRRRAVDVERQLRLHFADYRAPRVTEEHERSLRHGRKRPQALAQLALLLRRLRAPGDVVAVLCGAGVRLPGRCRQP